MQQIDRRAAKYSTNWRDKIALSRFTQKKITYFVMRKITFRMQMFGKDNGNHDEHDHQEYAGRNDTLRFGTKAEE